MDKAAVDQLLELLTNTYKLAVNADQKIMALEIALRNEQPVAFNTYRRELEAIRDNAPELPPIDSLRAKLLS